MINMDILLGLQVKTGIVDNKLDVLVTHNEYGTYYTVLTPNEFLNHINTTKNLFSDSNYDEPSNRLYVTGLNGYCIFENSSKKDIEDFNKYVFNTKKLCHPILDVVIMIDIEDCLV